MAKKLGFPVAFFSNTNDQVDYAGIGVEVVSMKPGGGFQEMTGTSLITCSIVPVVGKQGPLLVV